MSEKIINVAFISYFFDMGGVQKSFLNLAEHLKNRGFAFHMINLRNSFFQDRFKACGVCHSITEPQDVIRYLQDNKIDIVHANNCDSATYFAYKAGVPRILERLDGYASAFIFDKTPVDCIVASTNAVYERALKEYPHKNVNLISNGVDTSLFRPDRAVKQSLREELNIKNDDFLVGYLGRISREKRQDWLIDIFSPIARTKPNIKLVLIGNDHNDGYREELKDKIKALDLGQSVFLLNGTEHPEDVVGQFDLNVICTGPYRRPDGSEHIPREGYPNAVMESMACGRPVVATNCGEIPSLVQDGITGLVVDVDDANGFCDAIVKLSRNERLRKKMGEKARRFISSRFSLDAMVDNYEQLYRQLITPGFQSRYADARLGTEQYFMTCRFDLSTVDADKKILVIRSGSKSTTDLLVSQLVHRGVKKLSFLCNKRNYPEMEQYEVRDELFVYGHSPQFDPALMSDVILQLNNRKYDYMFFILNTFKGLQFESSDLFYASLKAFKGSKNIFDLCNAVSAEKKVVVTSSGDMYNW